MTTMIDLIERARELLDDESRWLQGPMFQDEAGREVMHPESACRWCLQGAVWRAAWESGLDEPDARDARDDALIRIDEHAFLLGLIPSLYPPPRCYWNDDAGTSHADVLRVLDSLIDDLSVGRQRS